MTLHTSPTSTMAQMADIGEKETELDTEKQKIARLCKLHMEFDRSMRAKECGYSIYQCKVLEPELNGTKSDLLFGFPAPEDSGILDSLHIDDIFSPRVC
jgi:hypothetical protein